MRAVLLAPALVSALLVAGCSGGKEAEVQKAAEAGVQVTDARLVLPIVKDNPGAVYFNLVNASDAAKKVTSIDVVGTDMAMIHDTVDKDGKSTMVMLHEVAVPAKATVIFAPGGRHVMVMGIKPELKAGATAELKVNFEGGDVLEATIPVTAGGN